MPIVPGWLADCRKIKPDFLKEGDSKKMLLAAAAYALWADCSVGSALKEIVDDEVGDKYYPLNFFLTRTSNPKELTAILKDLIEDLEPNNSGK